MRDDCVGYNMYLTKFHMWTSALGLEDDEEEEDEEVEKMDDLDIQTVFGLLQILFYKNRTVEYC